MFGKAVAKPNYLLFGVFFCFGGLRTNGAANKTYASRDTRARDPEAPSSEGQL